MPNLDWENVWLYGAVGEYPSIVLNHGLSSATKDIVSVRDKGEENQAFVLKDSSQPNSENNPYIVETAAQMYMLMRGIPKDSSGNTMSTAGVYFKVADGIDAFCMTSTDLMALNNVDDVKAWFNDSNNKNKKVVWSGNNFEGHFDGNGVTVYGVLGHSDGSAALFPNVSGAVTIKNVTIKNSYLVGASAAAGIVGTTNYDNNSAVTLENCAVINCYVEAKSNTKFAGAASLVCLAYSSPVIANDILVYGNEFVKVEGHSYGPVSYGANQSATKFTNMISIGFEPYRVTDLTTGNNASYHNVKNDAFSGVYTDKAPTTAYLYEGSISTYNYKENQVKQLTIAQMQGPNAEANMPYLAWASKGGDWYAGAYTDYPSFEPAGSMPSNTQSAYDSLTLGNYNTSGSGTQYLDDGSLGLGVYDTTLVLKTNPYMSFIFAFNKYQKNKGNGDQITVTFKSGNTVLKTVTADDKDMLNSAANGRYHKYYLRDIPITTLASGVTVEVTMDTVTYNIGTYSAEGFALEAERNYRNNPCDYYKTRYEAAKALVFYAQMLDARYGGQ